MIYNQMAEAEKEDNLDNLSSQINEIEVLTSIYGDDWQVEDEASRKYQIDVKDDTSNLNIKLEIHLPDNYPSEAPPQYTLSAPWLRGPERRDLDNALSDVYLDNMGETIIYLWVERVREFLQDKAQNGTEAKPRPETPESPAQAEASAPKHPSPVASPQPVTTCVDPDISVQDLGLEDDPAVEDQGEINHWQYEWKKSKDEIKCPEIHHSEFLFDRKSKFQSHLAIVNRKEEIDLVMEKLKENRKIAAATHNIIAYRIRVPNSDIMYQSCEDDGEFGAGSRMLHLLNILQAENVMVVVTRWYGGIHLGPDRFKHINNLARELLHQHGFIREKEDKKGPRTGKKR